MIEIKNRFTGGIIHSGDFQSVKECLLDAIKNDANLRGANLRGADLRYANLEDANLRGADLRYANLEDANLLGANLLDADLGDADLRYADLLGANLRYADLGDADLGGANLGGANLRYANLRGADLRYANLGDADLRWCAGNKCEIKSLWFSDVYPITYTSEYMQIGCERHKIADWWEFDDKRILKMDGKTALKFWRENKDLIKQIVDANPAKPTGKESDK